MPLELFLTFLMIGFVSFGGGYAVIPLIREEVVERHGWMTVREMNDAIAVASMTPGPFAVNSAVFIGYSEAGIAGAIAAAAGAAAPSLILIVLLGAIYVQVRRYELVQSAFYGLRPVIAGLVVYAAILMVLNNRLFAEFSYPSAALSAVFLLSLAAFYFRLHPLYVMLIAGAVGAIGFV